MTFGDVLTWSGDNGVGPVKIDEQGRQDDEEPVGDGVVELRDVLGVDVVGFAPVHRAAVVLDVPDVHFGLFFGCFCFFALSRARATSATSEFNCLNENTAA